MVYRITIRRGKPTASDITLLRRLTNRSIADIRTALAGEGFHLTKDYREDLMEKDYEDWANETVELFSMLKQEFSEHTFEYGEEERWVKIAFEYLRNFLNSSVKERYQEHD